MTNSMPHHDGPAIVTTAPHSRYGSATAAPASQGASQDAHEIELSLSEPDRFGVIFDRYFGEIHGYVARRLGSDAADDIAADVFLAAFRHRQQFDASRGIVRGWLYGITTNHMARYRRREMRQYRAIERTGMLQADEGHEDRVADRVTASSMQRQLATTLAELSRGDREVLLLIALGGLSHAEVAAALSIPYGTVGSRLSRARRKLRTRLAAEPVFELEDNDNG